MKLRESEISKSDQDDMFSVETTKIFSRENDEDQKEIKNRSGDQTSDLYRGYKPNPLETQESKLIKKIKFIDYTLGLKEAQMS